MEGEGGVEGKDEGEGEEEDKVCTARAGKV